ncbi:MAG: hypothetical protein JXP34_24395, partial [Planctomycetes bacterium]|nr:hypothetical protein [Planctomycetota bacterium]
RVEVHPDTAAGQITVVPDLVDVPADRALDRALRYAGLGWRVADGIVFIVVPELARNGEWWGLPSVEDFSSSEDRAAFRALSREVEIDRTKVKTIRDFFDAVSSATGVGWDADRDIRESGALDLDFRFSALYARRSTMIPVLVWWHCPPEYVRWRIRGGRILVCGA